MKSTHVALLLTVALALLLSSCGGSGEEKNTTAPTVPAAEEKTDFQFTSLTIGGNPIGDYTIVYARAEDLTRFTSLAKKGILKTEYDFDRIAAEHLSDVIYERFGIRLPVVQDENSEKTGKEILIGKTNRALHPEALTPDDYTVSSEGQDLVLCGGAVGTTWHAAEAFAAWLDGKAEASVPNPDFTNADRIDGSHHLTRVACVGDSITYGATSTDPERLSYPANLQRLLWKECIVYNYGKSGSTMRNDLTDSYASSSAYTDCVSCTDQPYDLVLLMLGTNDSARDPTWADGGDSTFRRSCKQICDAVLQKSPNAHFVLMNCPAYYGSGNSAKPHIVELQSETARWMADRGYLMELYDMRTFTSEKMGSALFPDGLHPADEGYSVMAEGVRDLVLAVLGNQTNPYLTILSKS